MLLTFFCRSTKQDIYQGFQKSFPLQAFYYLCLFNGISTNVWNKCNHFILHKDIWPCWIKWPKASVIGGCQHSNSFHSICLFSCEFLLGVYFDLIEVGDENKIHIFGKYSHKYDSHGISILAVLCISVYIAIFSIGWGPLPWLLMSELLPPRARGVAGGIVACLNWSFVFLTTNLFHHLISTLYVQGTFWLFGGFALLSFLFTLFYVPETKGKTLEEIQEIFVEQ